MTRAHGRVLSRIWDDREFLALPSDPQRMYLFLLSQPDLSHAGLIPLRLKRWASKTAGQTPDDILRSLKALEASRFILVDEDTEEVLIRTFVRNDGVFKQPKVMIRMGQDARQIASLALRAAFIAEMHRLPLLELERETQRQAARDVIAALATELGERETIPEGYGEGYPSDLSTAGQVAAERDRSDHASVQVDTLTEGYPEGYGEGFQGGYGIPPAYAHAHSPSPLPPTPTPATKDSPSPAASAEPAPLDGLLVTPDGATAHDRRTLDDHFDEFWTAYPRKVGKQDARRVWDRVRKRVPTETILAGAQRLAADPNLPEDRTFIPHPATWITRGGWDDEPLPDRIETRDQITRNRAFNDPDATFGMPGSDQ